MDTQNKRVIESLQAAGISAATMYQWGASAAAGFTRSIRPDFSVKDAVREYLEQFPEDIRESKLRELRGEA